MTRNTIKRGIYTSVGTLRTSGTLLLARIILKADRGVRVVKRTIVRCPDCPPKGKKTKIKRCTYCGRITPKSILLCKHNRLLKDCMKCT